MISTRTKEKSGITLLALVVTIIVLLILAGVTIASVNGDNGVLSQSERAAITSEISKYMEEVELFKASKSMENAKFDATSLNAYSSKLNYNTKEVVDTGSVTDIIPDLKSEFHDGKYNNGEIEVETGKLKFTATPETGKRLSNKLQKTIQIAKDLGAITDAFATHTENGKVILDSNDSNLLLVDSNGTLTLPPYIDSNDSNLLLVDSNGTLTLPPYIDAIDSGTFSGIKGLKKLVIPYTVSEIRADAFSYNTQIEEVEFQVKNGQGCTSIGYNAFHGCTSLKKITTSENPNNNCLPNTLTKLRN